MWLLRWTPQISSEHHRWHHDEALDIGVPPTLIFAGFCPGAHGLSATSTAFGMPEDPHHWHVFSQAPAPPNHQCLFWNLLSVPFAAEVHSHNHAHYNVRMRMDRTHAHTPGYIYIYIIYIYIHTYNVYIYMCVCIFLFCVSCMFFICFFVFHVNWLRQMFATSPGFQQMPAVFSSSLRRDASSLVVCVDIYDRPLSQRGSWLDCVWFGLDSSPVVFSLSLWWPWGISRIWGQIILRWSTHLHTHLSWIQRWAGAPILNPSRVTQVKQRTAWTSSCAVVKLREAAEGFRINGHLEVEGQWTLFDWKRQSRTSNIKERFGILGESFRRLIHDSLKNVGGLRWFCAL